VPSRADGTGSDRTAWRMVEKTIELLSVVISVRISTQTTTRSLQVPSGWHETVRQELRHSRKTFSIKK
jgi:hypothetical protein